MEAEDNTNPADHLLAERGQRHSSPLATTVFVGLRLLDGFVLQRAIQVLDPIRIICSKLNIATPLSPPAGGALLSIAGQTFTPFQGIIWGMSISIALKQIYWHLFVSLEPISLYIAVFIPFLNFTINGLNTLLFSIAGSNPFWHPFCISFGALIFITGLMLEAIPEIQRRRFKLTPGNEEKPFSEGLFAYARNINYFGYSVYRTGFALAAGGLVWATIQAVFWAHMMSTRMIPAMERYCSRKYGVQWDALKKKVPWSFVPCLY